MPLRFWQSGLVLAALVGSWAAGVSGHCLAQPADEPEKPVAAENAPQPMPGEVLPQVFHLKDRDGNLQAVPGITYEQFMELWKKNRRRPLAFRFGYVDKDGAGHLVVTRPKL